jgi:ArsR family transcriptional regulator, arsenate/arsenite/antimonite-responsive transcriptional repressor
MIDVHRFLADDGAMPKPLPLLDPVPSADTCCSPLSDSPLSADEAVELASRLKALADPGRLRLVSLLLASDDQEACTCDLTEPLGLSQPTVSHHLKKLAEAGIVTGERRGVWTHYRVDPDALDAIAVLLTGARR